MFNMIYNLITDVRIFESRLVLINVIISVVLAVIYFHQYFYGFLSIFVKRKKLKDATLNRKFAYIICAYNEEVVIGNLVQSIYAQDYPKELMQVFVVADNCTDKTALIARNAGAIVIERFNQIKKGKSYALDDAIKKILAEHHDFDGYLFFDADNLVAHDYTKEMNKLLDKGYDVATSFRDTKNFDNWISAGSSMTFLRENIIIHQSRSFVGIGTYVAGTGFYVSDKVLRKQNGWPYHTLTEDIEFSVNCAIQGIKIGYCGSAVFYDEQPEKLKQSNKQRLRWCRGTHQIFFRYGFKLLKGFLTKGSLTCFEMFVHVCPLPVLTFLWSLIYTLILLFFAFFQNFSWEQCIAIGVQNFIFFLLLLYAIALLQAFIVTIKYHKNIKCKLSKQIRYCFTFPIYMMLFIPLSFKALFKKVNWVKVEHTVDKKISDL